MAMKPQCREEVEKALGRSASDTEINLIESALKGAMKKIYNDNPTATKNMSASDLYAKAVTQAKADIVGKAVEAKIRTAGNILKASQNLAFTNGYAPKDRPLSLANLLIDKAALDRSGRQSVENSQEAIKQDAWSRLPTLQDLLLDDAKLSGSMLDELFGLHSNDPVAAKAAQEFKNLNELLLADAQASGMNISPLDNWHMPQGLSSIKVAYTHRDEVVADLLNNTDHDIYRHDTRRDEVVADPLNNIAAIAGHEIGDKYTPEELKAFMTAAAETIATNGASKDASGNSAGSVAQRSYQKERQIHYKSAAAWRYMQNKYGDKTTGQIIQQHINTLSRDIALSKTFGTDYRGNFSELLRMALRDAKNDMPTRKQQLVIDKQASLAQRYFNNLVGDSGHTSPEGAAWARRFDMLRNAITFAVMGGSGVNSMPDMAGFKMVGRLSSLPEIKLWTSTLSKFLLPHRPEDIALANRLGLGVQTILADINQFVRDDKALTTTKRMAYFTTKYALLQRFERSKMMAVSSTLHDAIGSLTRTHDWASLPEGDRQIFESSGVDKIIFNIWKAADVERGPDGINTILMPQHIYDIPDAAIDLLIKPKIDAVTAHNKATIDNLKARSEVETGWVVGRIDKLKAYTEKLQGMLDKYTAIRDKNGTEKEQATTLRIEFLEAAIERSAAESDIASYLATQKQQNKTTDFLWDVAGGENIESIVGRSNSATQKFSTQRGRIGEALGQRLAKAEQRIKDAQKRLDEHQKNSTLEVDAKSKELQKRFDVMHKKTIEFHKKFYDSVTKRQDIINEWEKVAGGSIDKLRTEARRDAALKLAGTVGREVRLASGSPYVQRQVDLNMDSPRNGFMSEIQRSITFLKATPLSIVNNYWQRSGSTTNPMATRAKYLATSVALGAMVYNLKSLFAGNDLFNPFDTEQEKYSAKLVKSALTGGGAGIYGDLLLQDYSGIKKSTGFSGILGGPIIGTADDIGQIYADIKNEAGGGDADLGGDSVRIFKRHAVPNLFYTKALFDHLFFQQAQELFSPGYNRRSQKRMEKGSSTKTWWPAGEALPTRTPEFSK